MIYFYLLNHEAVFVDSILPSCPLYLILRLIPCSFNFAALRNFNVSKNVLLCALEHLSIPGMFLYAAIRSRVHFARPPDMTMPDGRDLNSKLNRQVSMIPSDLITQGSTWFIPRGWVAWRGHMILETNSRMGFISTMIVMSCKRSS